MPALTFRRTENILADLAAYIETLGLFASVEVQRTANSVELLDRIVAIVTPACAIMPGDATFQEPGRRFARIQLFELYVIGDFDDQRPGIAPDGGQPPVYSLGEDIIQALMPDPDAPGPDRIIQGVIYEPGRLVPVDTDLGRDVCMVEAYTFDSWQSPDER